MRKVHELKIDPEYFDDVESGVKPFEVRLNDRDYKVGDILLLKEWAQSGYTGRETVKIITYIMDDSNYYCGDGYVILGLDREGTDSGGWTPCNQQLPKTNDSYFVKGDNITPGTMLLFVRDGITPMWSDYCGNEYSVSEWKPILEDEG